MNGSGGPIDLGLTAEINKDKAAQERMAALQMVLDMHSRGLPVIIAPFVGDANDAPKHDAATVLKNLHDVTKKWHKYIFDGQAIG